MSLEKPRYDLSATQIISRAIELYTSRLAVFFVPFLLAQMINFGSRYALEYFLLPKDIPDVRGNFQTFLMEYLPHLTIFTCLLVLVWWITSTIANGIAVEYAYSLLEKGDVNLERGFLSVIYNIKTLLLAGFVTGGITALGFLCLIVPGILFMVIFSLVVPVIIIENRGALEGLKRSRQLVNMGWLKAFAVNVITIVIILVSSFAGEALGFMAYPLKDLIGIVLVALAQPIQPIAITLLYSTIVLKERTTGISPVPTYTQAPLTLKVAPYQKFCYFCGQEVPFDAVFCPRCGRQIRRPFHAYDVH
ncbi:TPA: hypothetical protein EYP70_04485 [Candidatus Bathyarchaeota archaeon]|nr:hypothetical protein [Candidatus Bathyarchaeota archaeon]